MSSGKRFGSWDVIALHILNGASRVKLRPPARLAKPRTKLERLHTAIGPIHTWDEILSKPAVWMSHLVLLGACLAAYGVWGVSAGIVISVAFAIISVVQMVRLLTRGQDGRLVVYRRRRTDLAMQSDAAAAAELQERRERWDVALMGQERTLNRVFIPIGLQALRIALVSLFVGASVFAFRWWVPIVLIVLGFVGMNWIRAEGEYRMRRVLRSLSAPICPDCGYRLDRGREVADHNGNPVHFGPPRCPECGTPWPLIPAPVRRVSQ